MRRKASDTSNLSSEEDIRKRGTHFVVYVLRHRFALACVALAITLLATILSFFAIAAPSALKNDRILLKSDAQLLTSSLEGVSIADRQDVPPIAPPAVLGESSWPKQSSLQHNQPSLTLPPRGIVDHMDGGTPVDSNNSDPSWTRRLRLLRAKG